MLNLQDYYNLKTKSIQVQAACNSKKASAQNLYNQYKDMKEKLENEKKSVLTQSVSIDTFKEILDKLSHDSVKKVADLLTYGLSVIFFDHNYSVEIVTSDQRNAKTAELYLVETMEDGSTIHSSFVDACGGGVLAVCGCILQVYFCNMLHQAPFLFMDEMLSQLSTQYIDTFMMFINELASTKNLILVLITHDDRYKEYANKTYHVSNGEYEEVYVNA